jgi:hypothetical protein
MSGIIVFYFIATFLLQIATIICIVYNSHDIALGFLITTTVFLSTMPVILKVRTPNNTTFVPASKIKILGYELKEAFGSKKENHT